MPNEQPYPGTETTYPTAIDDYNDPTQSNPAPVHDGTGEHSNAYSAIIALETFVGTSGTPGAAIPAPATTVTGPDAFGASPVVGASPKYARQDHDHGLPSAPAGVSPATTVTGPDAYGASAVVGTGTLYARNDHDHGLPAAPTTATTQSAGDNSTLIATDAFVQTAVNNAIAGVNPAIAVLVATTAAGNTSSLTYNNGVGGIGATFTGTANTPIVVDGVTINTLGQRLLVKNDTQSPSGAFNGIYFVTVISSALVAPVLSRALDYDSSNDMK